jgi:hypothetical protein
LDGLICLDNINNWTKQIVNNLGIGKKFRDPIKRFNANVALPSGNKDLKDLVYNLLDEDTGNENSLEYLRVQLKEKGEQYINDYTTAFKEISDNLIFPTMSDAAVNNYTAFKARLESLPTILKTDENNAFCIGSSYYWSVVRQRSGLRASYDNTNLLLADSFQETWLLCTKVLNEFNKL